MAQVQLGDGLIQHEAFDQDGNQVVVNQVTWQTEVGQALAQLDVVSENFGVTHFHSEEWSLVLHADMLCTVCQGKMAQVRQVAKNDSHV